MAEIKKKPVKIVETVLRDAHQSLIATRMKTEEMLISIPCFRVRERFTIPRKTRTRHFMIWRETVIRERPLRLRMKII